jgi:hypothetical protein
LRARSSASRAIWWGLPDLGRGDGRAIAQARLRHLVRRVADAQFDVVRVRRARHKIHTNVARALAAPEGPEKSPILADLVRKLATVDRYEGRALSRRKSAMRALGAARAEPVSRGSMPDAAHAAAFRWNKATAPVWRSRATKTNTKPRFPRGEQKRPFYKTNQRRMMPS